MSSFHSSIWVPPLMASAAALLALTVRCSTLLIGLLATLSKDSQSDRASIFREFALAISGRRPTRGHDCSVGSLARANVGKGVPPLCRECIGYPGEKASAGEASATRGSLDE